ncbi:MAG: glycosyltransferase family 39 protein [Candidatus Limnocylindrales bacterium]
MLSLNRVIPRPAVRFGGHSRIGSRPVLGFIALAAGFVAVAAILVFGYGIIVPDAWARLANGYYVLFSRDPHLAAVGFVWSPLPSLAVLPLLLLSPAWPALARDAFAANIMSALFMAGAAVQLFRTARDLGTSSRISLVIVALFVANPMILYHAANGLSEAAFLFFLIGAARYLIRWTRTDSVGDLAALGCSLGLAYLTRFEAIAAGAGAVILVAVLAFGRSSGRRHDAAIRGIADAAIVAMPISFVVLGWAFASWLIVGDALASFTAAAGAAQAIQSDTTLLESTGQFELTSLEHVVRQVLALQPFILPILGIAAVLGVIRRDARALAILATVGIIALVEIVFVLRGTVPGWFRYQIAWVPLGLLLAASAIGNMDGRLQWGRHGWAQAGRLAISATLLAAIAAAPISTVLLMTDRRLGGFESYMLSPMLESPASDRAQRARELANLARQLSAFLDRQGLPPGSVLIDASTGFPVIATSTNPRQFLATPDRAFMATLSDPVAFGVRYIVVAKTQLQTIDLINRQHPGIYETGANIGRITSEFAGVMSSWRIVEVSQ